MDSEEESASEEAEVESEEKSDSGVASLATTYVAKSIFNTKDNDFTTDTDANDNDYSTPTYFFMARGAKVNTRTTHYQTSSDDDSDCGSKPSYKHLLKLQLNNRKLWNIFKNC